MTTADEPVERGGFTMVEVIIALLILTVGILGLAATTAFVVRQVTMADVATERSMALQSAVEKLRRTPFDSVSAAADTTGSYVTSWTVYPEAPTTKLVTFTIVGPGLQSTAGNLATLRSGVADTLEYRIIRR